jgi:GT2 family glycosyltransferase
MSRTAIILVNWNGWKDCVECLSSLFASEGQESFDAWLVDNGSTDDSVEQMTAWAVGQSHFCFPALPGVRHLAPDDRPSFRLHDWNGGITGLRPAAQVARLNIVRNRTNSGFAGGNNVGIAAASVDRYSHFWLLNTDTVITNDALNQLLIRAAENSDVGMVGSTLVYYHRPQVVQALGGARFDEKGLRSPHIGDGSALGAVPRDTVARQRIEAEMAYVIGASMLVSSNFLRSIGPMCEDYFLYYEEWDWALRARGRYTLAYAPSSVVFHKVGGSSAKPQSDLSMRLLCENRLHFFARFMPDRLPQLRRVLLSECVRHLLRRRWLGAKATLRVWWRWRELREAGPGGIGFAP